MGLESSNARMANLARQRCTSHGSFTVEEITPASASERRRGAAMARRLFVLERIAVTLLGRLDGVKAGADEDGG